MAGFGAFGKTPSLGDFFRVDISADFVVPWDRWLQQVLLRVRADLGDRWQGCYTSAPIWRFSLSAGLAGPVGALGVLMPSVDRVGRQFPLTVMTPVPAGRSAIQVHFAARETFEALEHVALDALCDSMTRDALTMRLHRIRLGTLPGPLICQQGPGSLLLRAQDQQDMGHALAAHELERTFHAPSVWSSVLDSDSRIMTLDGLPRFDHMQGLFDLHAPIWRTGTADVRRPQ
jgi:type VI secretion system protein ImpM